MEVVASHRPCEDATGDNRTEEGAGTAGDDTSHRESHGHRSEPAPRQSESDAHPEWYHAEKSDQALRRSRQAAVKRRTFALGSCGPDLAAMPLKDPVDYRQADSETFELFPWMQALKNTEESVGVVHIEANTVVPDLKHNTSFGRVRSANLDSPPGAP